MTNLKSFWGNFYKSKTVAGACYLSKEYAEKHAGPNVLCAFELILCGDDGKAITDEKLVSLAEKIVGEQTKWQSIETAPKDGTNVLLYGRWKGEVSKNPEYWDIFKAAYSFDEWVVCDSDIYGPIILDPTHWQPLPKPPQEDLK